MSENRADWLMVDFQDLFIKPSSDIVDGPFGSNLKADEYVRTGIPIARLQNIDRNNFIIKNLRYVTPDKAVELSRHSFVCNDLLITKLGDPLGKACVAPTEIEQGVIVADVVRARFDHELMNSKFFCYQLNSISVINQFKEQTKGTTRPRINLGKIRSLKVWLASRNEQDQIVAKIEELLSNLDTAIARLERIKTNLKRYRASVLQAAIEGRLTAEWRKENPPSETGAELLARLLKERRAKWEENQLKKYAEQGKTPPKDWRDKYPEPVKPDTTGLPELPEGWVWASTEQLGSVQLGRQRSPKNRSKDHATVYIRAANITESGLDLSNLLDMEFTPDEQERYRLSYGDIVLSEASGSPSQVGKPAIWRDEITLCCFQNTVIRLRPLADLSEYLLNYYQHCYTNGIFSKIAGGVGINHLSADKFSNIPVALPPTTERDIIRKLVAARLNVAQRTAGKVENIIQQSEKLRQSILKRAFEGRLVPQDPNDETASALLERIRAERAKQAATVRPARTKQKRKGDAG